MQTLIIRGTIFLLTKANKIRYNMKIRS